jgi:hypothetical protein
VQAVDADDESVSLHEDSAGRLYLLRAGAAYGYDVTPVIDEQPGTFEEHAVALLDGETADWTVDRVPAARVAEIPIVATYDGTVGRVNVRREEHSGQPLASSAARTFIGPLEYVEVDE